ncbi:MAG: hypothetical protein HDT13_09635 [Butyrivibrio sp.]|nr:hypothetical protein [Butyrivibrio sp.]
MQKQTEENLPLAARVSCGCFYRADARERKSAKRLERALLKARSAGMAEARERKGAKRLERALLKASGADRAEARERKSAKRLELALLISTAVF